eukprot:SAG31_NODE_3158_length_4610_cov_2.329417_2_plen_38_part_00
MIPGHGRDGLVPDCRWVEMSKRDDMQCHRDCAGHEHG